VDEIKFKLRERERQRIFNAIKMFAYNHTRARNYMQRLLARLDIGLKSTSFKKWHKFNEYKNEKILKS
jgi:hypothetical protein